MPTPPFFYQELLSLGADDTEYRLLSKEGISTAIFEGREILKIAPETLAYLAREAFHDTNFFSAPNTSSKSPPFSRTRRHPITTATSPTRC